MYHIRNYSITIAPPIAQCLLPEARNVFQAQLMSLMELLILDGTTDAPGGTSNIQT